MKKLFTIILVAACFIAEAQVTVPQPSPAGSVSSTIGLTDVKIDYSRPRLKGRKVFGEKDVMYPHGTIWRTGANSGTKITFSDDVKVEGIAVPKGEYLIFTWPGASEWTVSLYNDLTIGGNTSAYDKSKEVANFKVKSEKLAKSVETFTISISDLAADNKSGVVTLAWEKTAVSFTVSADYDAKVMKSIESTSTKSNGDYYQAAVYYLESGKDLKQALEWINIPADANKEAFWVLYQKARIQKGLGDNAGAKATATASLELSKKAGNRDYQKMNEDLLKTIK